MNTPKKLSPQGFEKAKSWIRDNARPLDVAHWQYLFENGSSDRVWKELRIFQNTDGGFRFLEMDVRMPHSSPVCTSIALHYLVELRTPSDHPLVRGAVSYLLETLNREMLGWKNVSKEINDYPHAPWWTFDPAALHSAPDSPLNPTAEVVGWFHAYNKLIRPELLAQLTENVYSRILSAPDKMEMQDLVASLRMWERLEPAKRENLSAKLTLASETSVSRTPEEWEGYSIKPLWLAPSPSSLAALALAPLIEENLDWELDRQEPDGSWPPNWTWVDGKYADEWPKAEKEWRGFLTIKQVRSFRDFGRL